MSIDWNIVTAVGTFGQFVVVLVAAFLGLRQLRHMRRQSELDASLPLLAWIWSAEYQQAYPLVLEAAGSEDSEIRVALDRGDMADPRAVKVLSFAQFLNQIGLLISTDLIKGSTIIPYYRDAIITTWNLLIPFVVRRRGEEHGSSFFAPLEALVLRAKALSHDERFHEMRQTLPPSLRAAFDQSLTVTRPAKPSAPDTPT